MFKRILSLMLALMLLASLAVSVSAHDVPDRSRLGSVTITMTHRGDPIPGGAKPAEAPKPAADPMADILARARALGVEVK